MSSLEDRARGAERRARADAQSADWVDHAARVGLLTYGVVHLVIAWLALQLALGHREGSPSSQGAVRTLARQPFGQAVVWAIGVGMVLLAVWQVIEAWVGHRDSDGLDRVRKRLTSAGKAVVYLVIAVSAVKVASGDEEASGRAGGQGSGQGGGGTDTWTAKVMDLPGGQLLVGAVGLAVIGVGLYLAHRGWTEKFVKDLDVEGSTGADGTAYRLAGRIGYVAKGVAFGIVGALFVAAAVEHRPSRSGGLDQALRTLLQQPFGPVLLVLVAIGLAGYGVFCFARARHLVRR